ncbi:hypothetical protein HF086_012695 [Spodoptera exigua]|uniref:Uncharacterized protein n=1 Tax=Spodoptera exigua TaxID=7107 RepID=A0A922SEQ7_SPOEX|nr:hypothetical protein HF086_012695 [Spodoptera exigua]
MYFIKFWKEHDMTPQYSWVPVASIFLFVIFCTLGYLIIPWVRGIVGGMTTCVAHMSVFSVVKTFPYLKYLLNDYGVFGLYGTMSLLGKYFV